MRIASGYGGNKEKIIQKEWSAGRKKAFITSTIRGGFRRYPPKYVALAKACVGVKLNEKTGRQAKHYTCAKCKKDFPGKEVQVDHKNPVVDPKVGFVSWDEFILRLFCDVLNLQVLCKPCHLVKTKKEKVKRSKNVL